MTEDRRRLVFGCYTIEQFVFLIADDDPMSCPRLDHYGFSVGTEAELDDDARAGQGVPGRPIRASTSSTSTSTTTACSRSRRSTSATCCR